METEKPSITEPRSKLTTAIVILLCAIPVYATLIFGGVDSGAIALFSISIALVVVFWVMNAWETGSFDLYFSVLYLPIIGLLVLGLIQLLPLRNMTQVTEVLGTQAAASLSLDPYATRLLLIRLVLYLVFFAGIFTFIDSDKRLGRVAWLVIIFGAIEAFFGILQWLAKPEAIYGLRVTPQAIPFGPFVNQHHFAAFMEMTGGLALGVLLGGGIKKDRKPLIGIAFVFMAVAVILTGSRGGLLSFAAVCVAAFGGTFFFLKRQQEDRNGREHPKRPILAGIAIVGAVLVAIAAVIYLGGEASLLRGAGIQKGGLDITSGRAGFWSIAFQIFLSHPIVGAGLDAFGVAFTELDPSSGVYRVEQAHNDYLQALADGGILAVLCVSAFIYLLFRNAFRRLRLSGNALRRSIAVGALAGCAGVLIHSFLDFPLRTPANAFFFLLLTVLATAEVGNEEMQKP